MQKTIDPITLEVIHHRIRSIANEMQTTIYRSGRSPINKEMQDNAADIFDAKGQMIAQSSGVVFHIASQISSVQKILEEFPASEMREGDIYLQNDPYNGGSHTNDITLVTPVTYGGEVVALCCSVAHQQDIGARTPGTCADSLSIYEEGIVLPPLKFYEAGVPVKGIHDIIRKNVRLPDMVLGDLNAQVAAGNVGKRSMVELFKEYGKDVVLTVMEQLLDSSETLTRQALTKIPDGDYSFADYCDDDGIDLGRRIKFQVKVTVRASEIHADFSGSSAQVRGPYNCVPSIVPAALIYVIKAITDPSDFIPTNAGCFRSLSYYLPEGSIVNPRHPAPVSARSLTLGRVYDVLIGAMIQAVPERLHAASGKLQRGIYMGGIDPLTGLEYVVPHFTAGGGGARPTMDGVDTLFTENSRMRNIPVEVTETEGPFRILKIGLFEDSGGGGQYRGGLGLEAAFELLRGEAIVTYWSDRCFTRPWGLFGGFPGSPGRGFIIRKSGGKEDLPTKKVFVLKEGDQVHFWSAGGGGYGDPLNRKPELVLQDVLNRKVSIKTAEENYGVVIEEKSMTIDFEKTKALREEKARLRGPITWTYDLGPEFGKI
jgi:N-methylhydantoinase B